MVALNSQQSQEPAASTPYGLLCYVCAEASEMWGLGNTSPSFLSIPLLAQCLKCGGGALGVLGNTLVK